MAIRRALSTLLFITTVLWLFVSPAPPAQAAPLQQPWCAGTVRNLVVEGGFERDGFWLLGVEPPLPTYVTWPVIAGNRSMRVGNFDQPPNLRSYSTVRQRIEIPLQATDAYLTFQVLLSHEGPPDADLQEVWLSTPGAALSVRASDVVWSTLTNSNVVQQIRVRIDRRFFGRLSDLTFAVFNDGQGGRAWMVVDEVRLDICEPLPPATPTSTATATPTPIWPTATPLPTPIITPGPIPPGCYDILQNGDFEWTGAWQFGDTALPPFYAGAPPTPPSGSRMMALGAILPGAPTNIPSFSSIQQAVTIPASAQTASIRFQYYPISNASGGFNRQELVLLDPLNYAETIEVLWRVTDNANRWLFNELDLTRHIGRTVTIYFNARNAGDGRRTAMYLDEVQLLVCDSTEAMPWPEHPIWIETTAPVFTPTPTPEGTEQVVERFPEPGNQQTVIAVGTKPLPLDEITPGPLTSPIATPDQRRDGGLGAGIDLSASPWVVILVISAVILLAAVLALLFFRNER
jgi:hypothetical protein